MAEETAVQGSETASVKKKKKVNRMSAEELMRKIEELEKASLTGSVYYKHLLRRKRELGV